MRSTNPSTTQIASWLGFGIATGLSRTLVHFYPSSGNVTAPYSANCKLTLFALSGAPRSVNLEGARVSYPDGVRLEEVFPQLKETPTGLVGIEIQLTTTQPRVDLVESSAILEVISGGQAARFAPCPLPCLRETPRTFHAIRDSFNTTSLIVVNQGVKEVSVVLRSVHSPDQPITTNSLAPQSVAEVSIPDSFFHSVPPRECEWGLLRGGAVEVMPSAPDVAYFVMYRDAATRRPISVRCL